MKISALKSDVDTGSAGRSSFSYSVNIFLGSKSLTFIFPLLFTDVFGTDFVVIPSRKSKVEGLNSGTACFLAGSSTTGSGFFGFLQQDPILNNDKNYCYNKIKFIYF